MKKRMAWSLVLVAAASAVAGFVVAQYTSATDRTAAAPAPAASPGPETPPKPTLVLPDFADIAERANPAVVGVTGSGSEAGERNRRSPRPMDPFHPFFEFGPRQPQRSAGSGFIISPDGYVFTNYHVVEGATKVEVEIRDKGKLPAKVVGQDPEIDLALLKVEPEGPLATLPLGDSDHLRVGEWVCAIGNPLFYDHSVTVGVVSAKGRHLSNNLESYIQTDAAINFGNSGGPLLNVRGEVIGINTAISAQGQNIGFAIPINFAREALPQLKEKGKVARGYLGAYLADIDAGLQKKFALPTREGALVNQVTEGGAGAKAGLKAGDVVIEVNGEKVENPEKLVRLISTKLPGERVRLKVIRDGAVKELAAVLAERSPSAEVAQAAPEGEGGGRLGIVVGNLDRRARATYRVDDDVEGVVVTEVDPSGPAAESLREGDVITEINRKPVTGVAEVGEALKGVAAEDDVLLYVLRDGLRFWITVRAEGKSR